MTTTPPPPPPELHLVGGAPRSGTTLLQAVLCSAEDTTPLLGESPFLCHLLDFYSTVDDSWDDDSRHYFVGREDAARVAREAVLGIFAPLARAHRCSAVVTKSPGLSLRPAATREVVPEARCYAILRDPRDTIALQIAACRREIQLGAPVTLLDGDIVPVSDEPRLWEREDVLDALVDRFLGHYGELVLDTWHLVSYEALVTRPREVIASLRSISGLALAFDPDRAWLKVEFGYLQDSRTGERAWRSDLWGRPVTDAKIGCHRALLPASPVRRIEHRCAAYVERWRSLTLSRKASVDA